MTTWSSLSRRLPWPLTQHGSGADTLISVLIENQVLPTQAIISSCFMEYTADNTGTIMLFVKKKVWINAFVRLLLNCLLVEIS